MGGAAILGALQGLNVSLIALGLVLIFRGNRFINFAQPVLGVIPMMLLGRLVIDWGLNWWLAFVLMVAAGAAIGAASDFLIFRPLRNRGTMTLLVASIGLSQIMLAFTYFRWIAENRDTLINKGYPVPFHVFWLVQSVPIYGQHVLTMAAVPSIAIALYLFFKKTKPGKAIRAAATNPEAAALAAMPVLRLSTITWAVAGALSAITAILSAPDLPNFDATALGPQLVLPALGAAALGAFTSFTQAFAGGVGFGILNTLVVHWTGESSWGTFAVFAGVVAVVFIRSKAIGLAGRTSGTERLEVDLAKPVPPAIIADRFWVKHSRALLIAFGIAVAVVIPFMPYFNRASNQFTLTQVLITCLVVVSVTIMSGWGGQLSLGQYAFVGVGGMIAARFLEKGWSLPAVVLVAGVIGSVVALAIGLPALRYKGLSLAVITLGFAVIAPSWLFTQGWFTPPGYISQLYFQPVRIGGGGIGHLTTSRDTYFAILVVVVVALIGTSRLRTSAAGRAMIAVRDNEEAVASIGLSPTVVKLGLFALVGLLASVAGALDVVSLQRVYGARYTPDYSLLMLSVAVIGGMGSIPGAVLASIAIVGVPTFLYPITQNILPGSNQVQLLLGGISVIGVLLALPGGMAGDWRRNWIRIIRRATARAERARRRLSTPDQETEQAPSQGAAVGSFASTFVGVRGADRGADAAEPLRLNELVVRFGALTAVDGVTLNVGRGEIVGLIGTNGAGKTTIINAISGHLRASGGSVMLFDQDATGWAPQRRAKLGLGRTFQDARLYQGLTTREIVQVALARDLAPGLVAAFAHAPWVAYNDRATARRADEVLELLGLRDHADTTGASLSTGLRRVVDLAIQVARQPALVLLDEPTAGLAQREAEAFVPLLRRIAQDLDVSILIIEHDMPVILNLASRIYCLELGKVIAEGVPDEIRRDARVVESYLGTGGVAAARSGKLDALAHDSHILEQQSAEGSHA